LILIVGTSGKDKIIVSPQNQFIKVYVNGSIQLIPKTNIVRILAFGREGNDFIQVVPAIKLDSILDGGAGNDDILGGGGADILIGAEGNDHLVGGSGRDILIGGDNTDVMAGGLHDDILIGGRTVYDQDLHSLFQILAKWKSAVSYSTRVSDLLNGNGTPQLSAAQIADAFFDTLVGDADNELFFFSLGDTVTGKKNTEVSVKVQ
jgi:Ca2+-binding RTX toxin-like protein